jgi:hypothetical protein
MLIHKIFTNPEIGITGIVANLNKISVRKLGYI